MTGPESEPRDLTPEFYLPPQDGDAFARETRRVLAICVVFIAVLGALVALTQDVVITVG